MVDLIFIVSLDIDPSCCDEYGKWISDELYMILSAEGTGEEKVIVKYCGDGNG